MTNKPQQPLLDIVSILFILIIGLAIYIMIAMLMGRAHG